MAKVIVGLSGGVDSAVAALLLKQAGYDVEALFMRNWDATLNNDILGNPQNYDEVCPQEQDYQDACHVAELLGIKLHRHDFVKEYWDRVFMYFLDEYRHGRTPNPDILCNSEIKFKAFLEIAESLGADYIAMGHFARKIDRKLYKGIDKNKDQTYFLSQLTPKQFAKALFPIGHLTKSEVRKLAREAGFTVADKKDSTGVCFIGERDFKLFLQNYLPAQPGEMHKLDGTVVGEHDGVYYYTIGQRHGLNIGGPGGAWFVIGKDVPRNILYVGQDADEAYLNSNWCVVKGINWMVDDIPETCHAKFRYRQKDIPVKLVKRSNDVYEVHYENARAVTPGQAAVFYQGDLLLGGGFIDEVYWNDERRKY